MDPANTGLAGGTIGWEDITGIDGGTGTTCVMHFSKVYEGYLYLVAPLLPANYITSSLRSRMRRPSCIRWTTSSPASTSGPYIPTEAARPTRRSRPSPTASGPPSAAMRPYVDQVIWKYYADAATMIQGYKAGEYDVAQDLNDADIPSLAGIDQGEQVIHDSLTYELHAFNNKTLQTKFGADYTTIIKAIKLATDRQAIAAGPLGGNVSVSNNFISPLTWYYKDEGGSTAADPTPARRSWPPPAGRMGSDGYLAKNGKQARAQATAPRPARSARTRSSSLPRSSKAIGIKVDVNASAVQ